MRQRGDYPYLRLRGIGILVGGTWTMPKHIPLFIKVDRVRGGEGPKKRDDEGAT